MKQHIEPSSALTGCIAVPGDKSISHRAILFAAMAQGTSEITGVLDSADVRSTIAAVSSLGAGVEVAAGEGGRLCGSVVGWGRRGPSSPAESIDCGNSGTTARLLMGVLAGSAASVTLVGDESLSTRPMRRVTDPLRSMGALLETTPDGSLPVRVVGAALRGIEYASPVASAQVKSAVLLAGLSASGRTTVIEPAPSRDHTERMLPAFGVVVERDVSRCSASVSGPAELVCSELSVPGDASSAAFMCVAASLVPGSEVRIENISLNPTRTGFLEVLTRMGIGLEIEEHSGTSAEPLGDVVVRYTPGMIATIVRAPEVPSLIDEIPILALAAARCDGTTRFEGVSELRVKESDRLDAIVAGLTALGVVAYTEQDDLIVEGGGSFTGAGLSSMGDHRLAMTWAVAGLVGPVGVDVDGFEAVAISYPSFLADLRSLAG